MKLTWCFDKHYGHATNLSQVRRLALYASVRGWQHLAAMTEVPNSTLTTDFAEPFHLHIRLWAGPEYMTTEFGPPSPEEQN